METKIQLAPELERFAQHCVASGRFNNVSEVVRAGLRMLQDVEERRARFVASLDAAMAEGDREGLSSVEQVQADVQAAIDAVRYERRQRPRSAPAAAIGSQPSSRTVTSNRR